MSETSGSARKTSPNWLHRLTSGHLSLSVVITVVLVIILTAGDVLAFGGANPSTLFTRHYYMALGDSISFGFQPNLDFTSGFVDDLFADLQHAGVTDLVNYACAGETSTTMITGNCLEHLIHHDAYTGAQLTAALNFLQRHAGYVNPVTLDIGSNDVLPDFNSGTCTAGPNAAADLATLDANLTRTILPDLIHALGTNYQTGDLVMLNYYNPFARQCPGSEAFVHELNDHLAADAQRFGIPVADVYTAFGGDAHMADNLCSYTWICDAQFHDIHPTTLGYQKIAQAVEQVLSYPSIGPGNSPFPGLPFLGGLTAALGPRCLL
jgi:lysophospholipase L1-like esterase